MVMASARGLIAVDKKGGKVLFLNPVTYKTEVVLDGFEKTVHELLVVPLGPEYQARMRERLSALIARIRELDDSGTYRPNPAADCYFCDFKSLCSLYPEGQPVFPVPETERAPAQPAQGVAAT